MRDTVLQRLLAVLRLGSPFVILILIFTLLALQTENFLTARNLLTVGLQTSIIAMASIGMTFTIITGGIDLSVGSVAALCGALAAGLAVRNGLHPYLGIGAGLLVGIALGAVNGGLVVLGRIPPFVATLAMMAVARGLTLVYTQGRPISGLDERFTNLGTGEMLGLPTPFVLLLLAAIAAQILLRQTVFGLHVYAVGGGEETARLSGVRSNWVKFGVYVISGLTAAITGIILTARTFSAQPNAGVLLELDAIAASVLGGTSLAGGTGTIAGTVAGAFIIGALSNGLNLMRVPSYNQQVVRGLVFILAVLLDYFLKRRWQPKAGPQESSPA